MDGRSDVPLRQRRVGEGREAVDALLEEVLQPGTYRVEREVEDRRHDDEEGGNGSVATGQDLVDADAPPVFLTFFGVYDSLLADLQDEVEAHVGECGTAVEAAFLLHLADDVLDGFLLVLRQVQCFCHEFVAFYQLACGEADRNGGSLCVVLDEVHDGVQAPVNSAAVLRGAAEVLTRRAFIVAGHMDGVAHHLIYALVLHGADGDDGNAENLLHPVDADGSAVASHFVHHIESQHHGDAKLHELHGEVEVALDVGGIDDVDDAVGMVFQDEATADDFLARVGAEAVDAREVGDGGIGMSLDGAVLAVDGDAREVADVLLAARQLVEERRLSAVLIADESKCEWSLFCR